MKRFFAFSFLFLFAVSADAAKPPMKGIYRCLKGNEKSICDQEFIPEYDQNGDLESISIEYIGWCGSMGPYFYFCDASGCSDGYEDGIQVDFISEKTYRWENKQYGFVCYEMAKKRNRPRAAKLRNAFSRRS